jgi:uncharacterized membrane protein YhaH (DUF805 family)
MPTQKKQFGKRGLTPNVGQRWGSEQSELGLADGAASHAMPNYLPNGSGSAAYQDNDSFSIGVVVTHVLGTFFSFSGRIGRLGFWGLGTFNFVVVLAIWFAGYRALNLDFGNQEEAARILQNANLWKIWLITAPFGISNISLQVRRFHDRDVSGLWMLAWFIPIIGGLLALFQGIANMFFAGTPGLNRFDTASSQARVFD